ncbi:MAG: hypothetical protein QM726_03915 [Chitinophagaceae bacterium]
MSGSRTPTYIYIVIGVLLVYSEFGIKSLGKLLLIVSLVGGCIIGVFYFLGSHLVSVEETVNTSFEKFEKRRTTNKDNGEEGGRIMGTLNDVIFFPGAYPAIGVGLGATYQGAIAKWGTSKYVKEYPSWLEEEPERIVLEGGYLLLFFKIALFVALYKYLGMPGFSKLILFILIFLFVPIVYNTYNATYIFLGLIFLDKTYQKPKYSKPSSA